MKPCRLNVEIAGLVDNVPWIISPHLATVIVISTQREGGVRNQESLLEHLDRDSVITSSLAEREVESGPIPCHGLDGLC